MKYSLLFFVAILAFVQPASAQQTHKLAGHWKGKIYQGNTVLGNFKTQFKWQDGQYSGTFTVQGKTFPFKKIHITKDDSVLLYIVKGMNGKTHFKGTFTSDSLITGKMIQKVKALQRSASFQFKLKRYAPKTIDKQKEAASNNVSKPYHHKDIIIHKNDSIQIGGTLTWPKHENADQLVIMTTGSGAENRNEEMPWGFKIFGQIADYLTRHGIATFRYDDRGVGKSTGVLMQSTLSMLASDVQTIVAYFSDPSHHTFKTIALLGHSGGGEIDGIAASRDSLVDKLILMSSPGISLKKVLHYQVVQMFSPKVPDSIEYAELRGRERLMKALRKDKNVKQAKKSYRKLFKKMQIAGGLDSTQALQLAKRQTKTLMRVYSSPKFQSQLFHDPTSDLKKLDIPVLATFGGKDTQVLISKNLPPIRKALGAANVSYQINVFKNANHLYQHAKTGAMSEYASLPSKFVEGFLPTIVQWLKRTEVEK